MKNLKLKSFLFISLAVSSLFSTGCVTAHKESGERFTMLGGLVDVKENYSLQTFISNDPLTAETYNASGVIPSDSIGTDYTVDGKVVSLLWGVIRLKTD